MQHGASVRACKGGGALISQRVNLSGVRQGGQDKGVFLGGGQGADRHFSAHGGRIADDVVIRLVWQEPRDADVKDVGGEVVPAGCCRACRGVAGGRILFAVITDKSHALGHKFQGIHSTRCSEFDVR